MNDRLALSHCPETAGLSHHYPVTEATFLGTTRLLVETTRKNVLFSPSYIISCLGDLPLRHPAGLRLGGR